MIFVGFLRLFSLKININNTFTHCNLGYGRAHMGNNGNRCVFMGVLGCRDMKSQQNEVIRDKNGQTGHILRPYDRRNFPKRHVFEHSGRMRVSGPPIGVPLCCPRGPGLGSGVPHF